jgi:hypothetical protein
VPFSSADPADYLAIGRQTNFETESSTFRYLRHLSGGLTLDQESETIYEGGGGQDPTLVYKTKVKPDGEIEAYARPVQFGVLAAYAMGSGVTPASHANFGSHLYVPNATVPYVTVEEAFGAAGHINRVAGAIVSGFRVEGEAGQPWKITAPFIGGGTVTRRTSALTPAYESLDPGMFSNSAVLLNGATSLDITKFTYNFEKKVDDDLYTTNVYRRGVVQLTRRLGIDFTVIYQDANLYRTVQYGGTTATVLPADLATGAFRADTNINASVNVGLEVPFLRYTGVQLNRLIPDGETMLLDVSAEAVKVSGTHMTAARANIPEPTSYLVS